MYMRSGVFRGKESSNRIQLSQLVQDLLNFIDLGDTLPWRWGWVDKVGLSVGVSSAHMHAHTHMHAF